MPEVNLNTLKDGNVLVVITEGVVGKKVAARIITQRGNNPYVDIKDVASRVWGFGPTKMAALDPKVRFTDPDRVSEFPESDEEDSDEEDSDEVKSDEEEPDDVKPDKTEQVPVTALTFNFKYTIDKVKIREFCRLFPKPVEIVCLQEVAGKQWDTCGRAEKGERAEEGSLGEFAKKRGYKAIYCKAQGKAQKCEYIGMLYNDDKLELVTHGLLDAFQGKGPETVAQCNGHSDGRVFDRQPLLAVFRAKLPDGDRGQPFVVITYHLTTKQRATEVMWLCAAVQALEIPKKMFMLLTGDSNVPHLDEQWKYWQQQQYTNLVEVSTMTSSGAAKDKSLDSVIVRSDQKKVYKVQSEVLSFRKTKKVRGGVPVGNSRIRCKQREQKQGWESLSDHYPVSIKFDAPGKGSSEDNVFSEAFIKRLKELKEQHDVLGTVFELDGLVKPKPK